MSEANITRDYHPNGQIRYEGTIKDGKPIGMIRFWHENGVLNEELPCDDNGLKHGVVKTWNKDGKLLGECHFEHGTGLLKTWYDNSQLKSETYYACGNQCGRSRMWWEDGSLMNVCYYIEGRKVSKKKYIEACKKDPTLPRYNDNEPEPEEPEIVGSYKKCDAPASEWERLRHAEFINKFLRQPNRGEARQWLKGDVERWIGDLSHEDSVEFVEEGYQAGATKIVAVDIDDVTTDRLIVYLPPTGTKREQVFVWNNKHAQEMGFDPDEDWGQDELFVYFD